MRYHIYLTPEHKFLPNAIQYALRLLPFKESEKQVQESVDSAGESGEADQVAENPLSPDFDDFLIAEEFCDINDENCSDG